MAGRVLTRKFASGLFDSPLTPPSNEASLVAKESADVLAHEAAAQGLVLLQNNGVLPLKLNATPRIAVIGPLVVCQLSASEDSSGWFAKVGCSLFDMSARFSVPQWGATPSVISRLHMK